MKTPSGPTTYCELQVNKASWSRSVILPSQSPPNTMLLFAQECRHSLAIFSLAIFSLHSLTLVYTILLFVLYFAVCIFCIS